MWPRYWLFLRSSDIFSIHKSKLVTAICQQHFTVNRIFQVPCWFKEHGKSNQVMSQTLFLSLTSCDFTFMPFIQLVEFPLSVRLTTVGSLEGTQLQRKCSADKRQVIFPFCPHTVALILHWDTSVRDWTMIFTISALPGMDHKVWFAEKCDPPWFASHPHHKHFSAFTGEQSAWWDETQRRKRQQRQEGLCSASPRTGNPHTFWPEKIRLILGPWRSTRDSW